MKTLAFALMVFGLTGVSTAEAQPYGSYCSAYTYSGQWAVWFGNGGNSCNTVDRALGYAPVAQRRVGYYSLYGWNRVYVRCLNYRNSFRGIGAQPARQAYNAASWANGQRCLFSVR